MIPDWLANSPEIVGRHHRPPTLGQHHTWPVWLPDQARERLAEVGITAPWRHQVEFADRLFQGEHCAITTPTASGKTLGYLMPLLAAREGRLGVPINSDRQLRSKPRHTALYLAPTKALAHDQYRAARGLGVPGWRVGTLDGDSNQAERRFARDEADYVLTNPDMLHFSVLPAHGKWSSFLGSLRYIIVDEAHRYRGTFGAHVALVLRRLLRLCAGYGATPTVAFASATSPNAALFCGALIANDDVKVVAESTAPRPALDLLLWRPATAAAPDTARLLADLVDDGRQTIAFVASRNLSELTAVRARERARCKQIGAYRSGYLANDRRGIESALQAGQLRGVAATNALELGVDISGMDAVLVQGFPGTAAALWQQFGRAGRANSDALAVLVARDDPLDNFVLDNPGIILGDLEDTVVYPGNPYILGPHLAAAAAEAPLALADERWFGPTLPALADHLVGQGLLRRRALGWYWTRPDRAVDYINLRAASGAGLDVIDVASGRVVGTVDAGSGDKMLHDGAVYLHQGEQYLVTSYEPEQHQALVRRERVRYYTQPTSTLEVDILRVARQRRLGRADLFAGDVRLTSQVTGYLRRDEETHAVWDQTPLDLPPRTFTTQAIWWTIPAELIAETGLSLQRVGAAAHAMEHCAIGLLPGFTPCDRWDIGGVSMASHAGTGEASVFVHDGMPGGAGFAYRGYEVAETWLAATLERLTSCTCELGCPACVVSPKCGNANQHLDRFAARDLLGALLRDGQQVSGQDQPATRQLPAADPVALQARAQR